MGLEEKKIRIKWNIWDYVILCAFFVITIFFAYKNIGNRKEVYIFSIVLCLMVLLTLLALKIRPTYLGKIFSYMNKSYYSCFHAAGILIKSLFVVFVIVLVSASFYASWQIETGPIRKILVGALTVTILYFLIGLLLSILNFAVITIVKIGDNDVQAEMISILAIISITIALWLSSGEHFPQLHWGLLVVGICLYALNMHVLFRIVTEPKTVFKSFNGDLASQKYVLYVAVFILVSIILNLYLFVIWSNSIPSEIAYSLTGTGNNWWQLFHYTVISFTTIGYGDIEPLTAAAQAVSVLISISSVICLIVFVNTIISNLYSSNEDEKKLGEIEESITKLGENVEKLNNDCKKAHSLIDNKYSEMEKKVSNLSQRENAVENLVLDLKSRKVNEK